MAKVLVKFNYLLCI